MSKIKDEDIQELKSRVKFKDILAQYNIGKIIKYANNSGNTNSSVGYLCNCPLHNDRHPSFLFNEDTGIWTCQTGCGSGDKVKLIMELKRCSFRDALSYLSSLANYRIEGLEARIDDTKPPKPKNSASKEDAIKLAQEQVEQKKSQDYTDYYNKCWADNRDIGYSDYMISRGISTDTMDNFCIGIDSNWQHPNSKNSPRTNRVIIPRACHTYLARSIDSNTSKQYQKQIVGIQKTLFNYPFSYDLKQNLPRGKAGIKCTNLSIDLQGQRPNTQLTDSLIVYVAEGEIDTLSIAEVLGLENGTRYYNMIGIGSDNNADLFIEEAIKHPWNTYIILLDNDNGGQTATQKIADALDNKGINYLIPSYPSNDINECLQHSESELRRILYKAGREAQEIKELYLERKQRLTA